MDIFFIFLGSTGNLKDNWNTQKYFPQKTLPSLSLSEPWKHLYDLSWRAQDNSLRTPGSMNSYTLLLGFSVLGLFFVGFNVL